VFEKCRLIDNNLLNILINTQWCISQMQQNIIMFISVVGQYVEILTESSSGPSKI